MTTSNIPQSPPDDQTRRVNIIKQARCPRCKTKLHRDDIQEVKHKKFLDFLGDCPICGNMFFINRIPR